MGNVKEKDMRNVRLEILRVFRMHNKVSLQNILMKIPDREIAVSISVLDDMEKQMFFSLVSQEKVKRIKEELNYQKQLDIRKDRYLKIADKFISYFTAGKKEFRNESYIRPKRLRQ